VRLVVGLGNPGAPYEATRHNVAWQVLDALAERLHAEPLERGGTFQARRVRIGGEEVALLAPQTYMNRSGDAMREWEQQHGLDPDALLVVSDDVYLPLGMLRLRAHGSSGGHRGLESLEEALGHRQYARLRIGVGAAESSAELREHVLEEFTPEEIPALQEAVRQAADAVECWVSEGIRSAMNRFNRRIRREDVET
jgi:PTH1 family peptidyl-tRNA hydrolase